MWKFEIFPSTLSIALPLLLSFMQCDSSLDYRRNCTSTAATNKCLIEATFGRVKSSSDETVDVLIDCTAPTVAHQDPHKQQFGTIEAVVWNGCSARQQQHLADFGLGLLLRHSQIKWLRIEHFTGIDSLGAGTFDKFVSLENLEIVNNSIDSLSVACFRGLSTLKTLSLTANNLKWIAASVLSDLPKLSTLRIDDREQRLLITTPQLTNKQIVDEISLTINAATQLNFLEHLLSRSRNLSLIVVNWSSDQSECEQIMLNGYEKSWIIAALHLENLHCGFTMNDVESIKSLQLNGALGISYPGTIRLKGLPNLEQLVMHENNLVNFTMFDEDDDEELCKLNMLDLSRNYKMYDFDMQIVERCRALSTINLIGNELTTLKHFQDVSNGNDSNNVTTSVLVDGNQLRCSWLSNEVSKASSTRLNLVIAQNFRGLNFRGIPCTEDDSTLQQHEKLLPPPEAITKVAPSSTEAVVLKPIEHIATMSIISIFSLVLGVMLTLVTLQIYRKYFVQRQQPFYHLLRDSLPLPAVAHMRRRGTTPTGNVCHIDIVSRDLPATNYEHPISESTMNFGGEFEEMFSSNIYEEIPVVRID